MRFNITSNTLNLFFLLTHWLPRVVMSQKFEKLCWTEKKLRHNTHHTRRILKIRFWNYLYLLRAVHFSLIKFVVFKKHIFISVIFTTKTFLFYFKIERRLNLDKQRYWSLQMLTSKMLLAVMCNIFLLSSTLFWHMELKYEVSHQQPKWKGLIVNYIKV